MSAVCQLVTCCPDNPFSYEIDTSGTTYWNTAQCYTATCPGGTTGDPETDCVAANTYSNKISQASVDATALAAATAAATALLDCT